MSSWFLWRRSIFLLAEEYWWNTKSSKIFVNFSNQSNILRPWDNPMKLFPACSIFGTLDMLECFVVLFFIFAGQKSFLWGYWYPCFGLLVMSPLGFKATVGSLICTWWKCMCNRFHEIHFWCDTCQPLGGQHDSWADLFHIPASRYWWG